MVRLIRLKLVCAARLLKTVFIISFSFYLYIQPIFFKKRYSLSCADTQEPELAIDYITFRMSKLTDATSVLLYDQEYEAIEREDFPSFLADWQAELGKLSIMLESEEDPVIQRTIQERISIFEDRIANPPDSFRYEITTEEIQFYQDEVIPNIEFTYGNPITNSEPTSSWGHTLIKQYVEGLLSDDAFIRELDQ